MRNKYPGICYRCAQPVKPGEGHFEYINAAQRQLTMKQNRWRLQHAHCAIRYRKTNVGKEYVEELHPREPTESDRLRDESPNRPQSNHNT